MPTSESPDKPVIVLHHGLFGYTSVGLGNFRWAYFQGIDKALRKAGHQVIVSKVHPCGAVPRRAAELKRVIDEGLSSLNLNGHTKVLLVSHSMGGLDARYMIHSLGMHERVAGLLSITCPHRGSPYADWCVRHLGKRLGGFELMQMLGLDVEGINDLTTERCAKFNETIANVPGVHYFSV